MLYCNVYQREGQDEKNKEKFSMLLFKLTIIMATIAVNTTCARRYYQEEFDEQFEHLRRNKNG